jgi:hypothetical protein
MKKNLVLLIIHIFIVSLTINCYVPGSEEKGPFVLRVVPPDFEPDRKEIDFSLDGDPFEIKISGHAKADGCDVYLYICNHAECDKLFRKYLDDGDKYKFSIHEYHNYALDDYLSGLCPEDEEWIDGYECDQDMKIKLTSDCESYVKFKVDVEYSEEIIPAPPSWEDDDF